jgi:hypothetical protein
VNEIPTKFVTVDPELASALTRLPPLERYVLTLVYFYGRTQRQIAAHLEISPPLVARAAARGLQAIGSDLEIVNRHADSGTHVHPVPRRLSSPLTAAEPPAA